MNFQMSNNARLRGICIRRMVDTVVDDHIHEIERTQPREAGDIDAELIGIGSPFMMGINTRIASKSNALRCPY